LFGWCSSQSLFLIGQFKNKKIKINIFFRLVLFFFHSYQIKGRKKKMKKKKHLTQKLLFKESVANFFVSYQSFLINYNK
jgi:hypothetical protein